MTRAPDLVVLGRIASLSGEKGFGLIEGLAIVDGRVVAAGANDDDGPKCPVALEADKPLKKSVGNHLFYKDAPAGGPSCFGSLGHLLFRGWQVCSRHI